jgi:hypothetical protein
MNVPFTVAVDVAGATGGDGFAPPLAAGMHAQHSSFEADVRARAILHRLPIILQIANARYLSSVIVSSKLRQVRPLVPVEALPRAPRMSARRSRAVSGTVVASGGGERDGGVGRDYGIKVHVTRRTTTSYLSGASTTTHGPIALGLLPIVPTVWYTAAKLLADGRSVQLRWAAFLCGGGCGHNTRCRAFDCDIARRGLG